MPKSKTRKKKTRDRPYVPRKEKPKPKPSPRWYPYLMIGLMVGGLVIIVLNYMGDMIGDNGNAKPMWLWIGLGFIASGFLVATGYR